MTAVLHVPQNLETGEKERGETHNTCETETGETGKTGEVTSAAVFCPPLM